MLGCTGGLLDLVGHRGNDVRQIRGLANHGLAKWLAKNARFATYGANVKYVLFVCLVGNSLLRN